MDDNVNKHSNSVVTSRSNMFISGVKAIKANINLFMATCFANLATVAAGCVLSWSSPTIPKITVAGERILISNNQGAWLSSLVALGAGLGPFIAGAVVNKIGRKWTIIADMFVFLASWFMLAFFNLIYFLYLARVLAGVAVGCVFTVVPMYIAEISPLHLRSILGSLLQLFLCLGMLVSYVVGPYTSYLTLIFISAIIPVLCILTFVCIPESPHHLLNKDEKQQAADALQFLRGYPEKHLAFSEITDMLASAHEAKTSKGTIGVLLSNRGYVKALYYASALAFFQQMSGVNIVLFYGETIFKATGSSMSPSVSTIIIGLVMTAAAAFVAPAAKIVGIKYLLLFSAIGEAISLAGLGYYFYLKDNGQDASRLSWLPVTSLVCFIISYSLGFGPFVWVFMAEIFPAHLKAIASSVVTSFCWCLCFILTRYFEAFTARFGNTAAFGMFSIICVVAFLFVLFQFPDIQGKTYQEVQEMLTGKKKLDFSDIRV